VSTEVVASVPLVERTALRVQPVLSVPRSARAAPRHARARFASPGVPRLSLVRQDGRD
jgi:hypothetical protein